MRAENEKGSTKHELIGLEKEEVPISWIVRHSRDVIKGSHATLFPKEGEMLSSSWQSFFITI